MYVNGVLKAGQYVLPVPVGLPAVLQYGENGVLEKVFKRFGADRIDITDDVFDSVYSNQIAPIKVPIKDGTTWVTGVFYRDKFLDYDGKLPECIEDSMVAAIVSNSDNIQFYAGTVESLAVVFRGATPIRQWLQMSRFKVLPGWLLPARVDRQTVSSLFSDGRFHFKYPLISHYIVFDNQDVRIVCTELSQHTVCSRTGFTDTYGNIKVKLQSVGADWSTTVDYSDIVKYQIHKGTIVVQDKYDKVIYAFAKESIFRAPISNTLNCSWCGKQIRVPDSGQCQCSSSHCLSTMYPDVVHFLNSLKLPEMSFEHYKSYVDSGDITSFADIMLLPEYREYKLDVTLTTLFRAIIPNLLVPNSNVIQLFVSNCNNSTSVIHHYIYHPESIYSDFDMHGMDVDRLVDWLSDLSHAQLLETLMYSEQFQITGPTRKFDGSPILRGWRICLTGTFQHGSNEEVASILRSYSAEVTSRFDESVTAVIVGDLNDSTNGIYIRNAKNLNLPVISESAFFSKYEIDEDLKQNLLYF